MLSFLRTLVSILIDPVNVLFIIGLVALIFYFRQKPRMVKRTLSIAGGFFLLTASGPIPNFLMENMETRYQPIMDFQNFSERKAIDILVLGSGHTADPDLPPTDQLSASALSRLMEGIRIYKQLSDSRLILSGYGDESLVSQAEVMRNAAVSLGLPTSDLAMQKEPSNTAEEALSYAERFASDRSLILVTSAAHMPRAMYLFSQVGLDPIAAPTDFQVKEDPLEKYEFGLFSYGNFRKVELALHEYIGMLWAKMGGGQ